MCIYLLTCQPICIHSLLLGLFCSLILVKNWLKKFSIAEKKSFQFWIHCLHFQCIQWWNFYLPGLDAVQFQIPQCRIFSRSTGHQIFTNLKTFGEIVFARPFRMVLSGEKKLRFCTTIKKTNGFWSFITYFQAVFFKLEEKITKRVFSNLDFDALSSNTYVVYTFKYVSTYSLLCFHVQIFYLVQYILNLLFANQNHQKIYIMQTFLHIWNYGKMVLYLQTYFIFLYTYTISTQ